MKLLVVIMIVGMISGESIHFKRLNKLLEQVQIEQFITQFLNVYHNEQSQYTTIKEYPGEYFNLMGKIYLYNIYTQLPQIFHSEASLILAYYYFKIASQLFQFPQAYYYLALLQYFKITPLFQADLNLKQFIRKINNTQLYTNQYDKQFKALNYFFESSHSFNTESNLYIGSILGNQGAQIALAAMYKKGLGTKKDCYSSAAYYISNIKKNYVDHYNFEVFAAPFENYQNELFMNEPLNFNNEGYDDSTIIQEAIFLDSQTVFDIYYLATDYLLGTGGMRRDYQKAFRLFKKLADKNHHPSEYYLGMLYLEGKGTKVDRNMARYMFEQAETAIKEAKVMLIIMKYYSLGGYIKRKKQAIRELQGIDRFIQKALEKYFLGVLILKGESNVGENKQSFILLQQASLGKNTLAKIVLGLIFIDGKQVQFGCERGVNYFQEASLFSLYYIDKPTLSKIAVKLGYLRFAFVKELELIMVGNLHSTINAFYYLSVYRDQLKINNQDFDINLAINNQLYIKLFKSKIVPNMKQYIKSGMLLQNNHNTIQIDILMKTNLNVSQSIIDYILNKITLIAERDNIYSLKLYNAVKNNNIDPQLLKTFLLKDNKDIHVLLAHYLMGKYYQNQSVAKQFQQKNNNITAKNSNRSSQFYKERAHQQYYLATQSHFMTQIIYLIQQYKLGVSVFNRIYESKILQDLINYIIVISIMAILLYYKRNRQLDRIHKRQIQRAESEQRQRKDLQRVQQQRKRQQNKNNDLQQNEQQKEQQREQLGMYIGEKKEN